MADGRQLGSQVAHVAPDELTHILVSLATKPQQPG